MNHKEIIYLTENFVKANLQNAEGGHDWLHTERVRKMALYISEKENSDNFIVELAALLHDIADAKFHNGDENIGPQKAKEFLKTLNVNEKIISEVENVVRYVSFKSENNLYKNKTKEFLVVQDADRLDAMGAIGIARAFNYGGFKNREMYNPEIKPNLNMSKEEYKKSNAPTINHFYEKLLLLKNLMNTDTAKLIAEQRHQFMEIFLEQFYNEINLIKI
ncbi:MAG TPA: HD domain-containing protein [Bacteroidales bacterium]|nr:HD domain-containing protein [Bacteroidales bacterium]HPS16982.1 HD domain-containing protein [Bacteroidales bacterium]